MSHSVDTYVEDGDTVEVSDRVEMADVTGTGDGKYRLRVVYDDEPTEHVVMTAELGGDVDVHSRAKLAGFVGDKLVYLLDQRFVE